MPRNYTQLTDEFQYGYKTALTALRYWACKKIPNDESDKYNLFYDLILDFIDKNPPPTYDKWRKTPLDELVNV